MLHPLVPCAVSSTRLRHLRRWVSAPPRLTNWHFLPLNRVMTTSTRRSPAQPRSFELPPALMPFLRETCSFLRSIELRGASLSVQPPGVPPPLPFPFPLPPPGGVRSTSARRPTLP